MKGDFTRSTFRAEKHYRGVRMQQGRVQLDADWNEQLDIAAHRTEIETGDVIGRCGGPLSDAGFSLSNGAVPAIGKGRYYVNGVLCENDEAPVPLDKQPDLPVAALGDLISPKSATIQNGLYLAYLDVWQRHITALEDDGIREVALGGPDTATRAKTIWQVKLLGPFPAPLTCVSEPAPWVNLLNVSNFGKLSARAEESGTAKGPCIVPPSAGYRRLENQLYRVEIHEVDGAGKIKVLKWSRDNGSVLTRWLDQKASSPGELIVSGIGRDEVLKFAPGQYGEILDDQRELRGEAGILVKLANAEGQVLTLDTTDPNAATVHKADFPDRLNGLPNNPKVRRWDGIVRNPLSGSWFELEDGVQIKLDGGKYHVSDYWLIPARTATGDVEWPRDNATPPNPIPQFRAGIEHAYCKLAILNRTAGGFTVVQDCRELFPPLTDLVTLLYAGGDGQEAMPGNALPQTLRVRVVNGQTPVIGAKVLFTVKSGGGSLSGAQPVATTGPNGMAECTWTLGASGAQQVEAVLLDAGGTAIPGQILRFSANLSIASQVAYDPSQCPSLSGANTVQAALDILCKVRQGGCCVCVGKGGDYERLDEALKDLIGKGERDLCLCLLPGDQDVEGLEIERKPDEPDLQIKIVGCGAGSRVILHGPMRWIGVNSVMFQDFAVEFAFFIKMDEEILPGALAFDHCAAIDLRGCTLSGFAETDAVMSIVNADRVRLADSLFEALLPESLAPVRQIFAVVAEKSGVDLATPFGLPEQGELRVSLFRQAALKTARMLASLDLDRRKKVQAALQEAFSTPGQPSTLSPGELLNYVKLALALSADVLSPATAFDLLLDIRRTAAKTRPGTAIILERPRRVDEKAIPVLNSIVEILDQDDGCLLENNDIVGILSLYGQPADIAFVDEQLNVDILQRIGSRLKENQLRFSNNFLGTLQLRGNQLVRVAVAREIVAALREAALADGFVTFPFDLFSRFQWGDNVFEGGRSLLVCRHLTLHGNEFTQFAQPTATPGATANQPNVAGTIVADSTVYLANHGTGNMTLLNRSRLMEQVANQELSIT